MTHTPYDIDIMTRTLFGEAKANDSQDATAIAHVIRNRYEYQRKAWGLTIAEVCLKPKQFSCWNTNDPNRERIKGATAANSWFAQCYAIVKNVLDGLVPDPTSRSTHYHTPAVAPQWSRGKHPIYITNGHKFFNDIDTPKPAYKQAKVIAPAAATATAAVLESTGITHVATAPVPDGVTLNSAIEIAQQAAPVITPLSYLDWRLGVAIVLVLGIGGAVWYFTRNKRK
jgi:N-acetylmuramoyl-L-alanine amidase